MCVVMNSSPLNFLDLLSRFPRPVSTSRNWTHIASRNVDKNVIFVPYFCGDMPKCHRIHASVAVSTDVSVGSPRKWFMCIIGKKQLSVKVSKKQINFFKFKQKHISMLCVV